MSYDRMNQVYYARLINQQCGGAVIAPWEVTQLDEEWIEVFFGLIDLPRLRESQQAFERKLMDVRRKHPTYRKYLS